MKEEKVNDQTLELMGPDSHMSNIFAKSNKLLNYIPHLHHIQQFVSSDRSSYSVNLLL